MAVMNMRANGIDMLRQKRQPYIDQWHDQNDILILNSSENFNSIRIILIYIIIYVS